MNALYRQLSVPLIVSCCLLLASCGGGYQAPISEQGEQQRITAPIIVDSSTPESSLRLENSRPVNVSSSGGGSRIIRGGSSDSIQGGSRQSSSNQGVSNINGAGATTHLVRSGDTLFSIAFQYDLDFRSLAIANGLNPPYTIFVNREINLDLNNIVSLSLIHI